ncbi:hypothetical protein GW17_00040087 [Ensete ventricosum]|nr:hypothetical protein GW17_00040087 [Ensete ventricosum]
MTSEFPTLPLPISALFFLLLPFSVPAISHPSYVTCGEAISSCGNITNITYPFWLVDDDSTSPHSHCGYRGFELFCRNNTPIIHLPSGNYTVTNIDYRNRTISLADTDIVVVREECPRVYHNLTFDPDSVLRYAPSDVNLTFFFDCTDGPPGLRIPCLGSAGGKRSYVFTTETMTENYHRLPRTCGAVVVVPVLQDALLAYIADELRSQYGGVLRSGFNLSWPKAVSGDCGSCERSGGRCGLNRTINSTWDFTCFCSDGIKTFLPSCAGLWRGPNASRLKITSSIYPFTPRPVITPPSSSESYSRYADCAPYTYSCGGTKINISYPFRVDGRHDYCGYPGYYVACSKNNSSMTIDINGKGYLVKNMDYLNHLVTVVDPPFVKQSCPQPYQNTTLDISMYSYSDRDRNVTVFVDCTALSPPIPPDMHDMGCAPGGRHGYYQLTGENHIEMFENCSSMVVVPMHKAAADEIEYGKLSFSDGVKGGFSLHWEAGKGWCRDCVESGGRCGFDSVSPNNTTCFHPHNSTLGTCPSNKDKGAPSDTSAWTYEMALPKVAAHGLCLSSSPQMDPKTLMRLKESLCVFSLLLILVAKKAAWASAAAPTMAECEPRSCGNGVNVSYPFWLRGQQPSYCGFPPFMIICGNGSYSPVLEILGHKFYALNIFYGNQSVLLTAVEFFDDSCPLPYENFGFNSSIYPFSISSLNRNIYFLLNCPNELWGYESIACARNLAYFGGEYNMSTRLDLASLGCVLDIVPVVEYFKASNGHVAALLRRGWLLDWASPDCTECTASGGRCGFNDTMGRFMCICPDGVPSSSCSKY